MVGKNNYKTRTQKAANKKQRFSLKKLSVGVASVAVGTTLFLGNAEGVSADENSDATTTDDAQGQSAVGSGYDFNEPEFDWSEADQVYEREQEEKAQELQAAKEAAIAEVQAAGFTDEKYAGWINAQETVQDVNAVKREILTTVPNEEQSGIEGATSVDSEHDFNAPDIDWSGAEAAYELEQEQKAQELQAAKEAAIAEVQAAGFTDEKYADWINAQETVQDVNAVKREILTTVPNEEQSGIEGEASVDSEYDFLRPDFDWSGLEEAIQDEESQEEVYTFVYITQNTKGKNGATTVKASSPEEALEYFQNWAKENDLGELDWSYDEDTKTFTGREKLEDDSDDDSGDAGEEKPGQDDSDSDSDDSTEDETDEEGKDGSDEVDDTTSDDSKDQKPGQDAPVKPGKGSKGQVATPVQDSKQASGQKAPVGQASGQAQASSQEPAKEAGQTLPDTATSTWALGLLGLTSLAGGLFAGKNKED